MVFLSFRNKGYRIRLLELGPFEAEEIVRIEPMAIVLRHPLIEHYDHLDAIAMMTFYCNSEQKFKHLKIFSNNRELSLYEVDGDFIDFPYYIHPENILSESYSGTSHSGTLNSSRSNSPFLGESDSPLSGTLNSSKSNAPFLGLSDSPRSHSGMSSSKLGMMRCARCLQRCRQRCSSCLRRRLRRLSKQSPMRRSMRRGMRRSIRRGSRSPMRRSMRRGMRRSRDRYYGAMRNRYSGCYYGEEMKK